MADPALRKDDVRKLSLSCFFRLDSFSSIRPFNFCQVRQRVALSDLLRGLSGVIVLFSKVIIPAFCCLFFSQLTKNPFYKTVVQLTLDYVLRDMHEPHGAFASAEDAGQSSSFDFFFPDSAFIHFHTPVSLSQTLKVRRESSTFGTMMMLDRSSPPKNSNCSRRSVPEIDRVVPCLHGVAQV